MCFGGEYILSGCFCQYLHGYGKVLVIAQTIIEARFIVHEIVLSCRPQKIVTIHIIDVLHGHFVLAVHKRVICQPGEKELYLMRYAYIETFINSIRNTRIYLKGRIRSKSIQALYSGFTTPWSESKWIEIVYTIRNAESTYERGQSDTSRYHEYKRSTTELLKNSSKPTQELVDFLATSLLTEHTFQEDRQFVQDEQYRVCKIRAIS